MIKKNLLTISLIVLIIVTRLLIINKDAAFFWADESRYQDLITSINGVTESGNVKLIVQNFFNVDARPGAALFYFLPAFMEWKIPSIPFGLYFNLTINILNLILAYYIVKKFQKRSAAVLVIWVLIFSIAPITYMRHLLPYDVALLLIILGVYVYTYFQKVFIFGLLTGFSFITYPSYYYYIAPIPLILILYQKSLKHAFIFIIGIITILLLTQLLSLLHTTSYFQSLLEQSGGVTAIQQGNYVDAASFMVEYIFATDGYLNLLLILFILPGLFLVKEKKIRFLAIYLILVFLILELFSHILQQHVLYGRTVRPFYLLAICLSAIIFERVLSRFKNIKIYLLGIVILLSVIFINFFPKYLVYKNLIYPEQFKKQAKDYLDSKYENYKMEDAVYVNYWDTNNPDPKLVWHFFKPGEENKYYTLNAIQTYPYYGNLSQAQFCKSEVLLKELHIQYKFKPYQLEGYKKNMRIKMEQDPLYYQLIYCNPQI